MYKVHVHVVQFFLLGEDISSDIIPIYRSIKHTLPISDVSLNHQDELIVILTAVNKAGRVRTAYSSPISVDNTPPVGGLVVHISDTSQINVSNVTTGNPCDNGNGNWIE